MADALRINRCDQLPQLLEIQPKRFPRLHAPNLVASPEFAHFKTLPSMHYSPSHDAEKA
jgi:hypothetical protein